MPKLIHTVPVPYLIVISGEVQGLNDAETQQLILNSVSFTAQMASCNRQLSIFVGADAVRIQGQTSPGAM